MTQQMTTLGTARINRPKVLPTSHLPDCRNGPVLLNGVITDLFHYNFYWYNFCWHNLCRHNFCWHNFCLGRFYLSNRCSRINRDSVFLFNCFAHFIDTLLHKIIPLLKKGL